MNCFIFYWDLFRYKDGIKGGNLVWFLLLLNSFIQKRWIHDAALGMACEYSSDVRDMIRI